MSEVKLIQTTSLPIGFQLEQTVKYINGDIIQTINVVPIDNSNILIEKSKQNISDVDKVLIKEFKHYIKNSVIPEPNGWRYYTLKQKPNLDFVKEYMNENRIIHCHCPAHDYTDHLRKVIVPPCDEFLKLGSNKNFIFNIVKQSEIEMMKQFYKEISTNNNFKQKYSVESEEYDKKQYGYDGNNYEVIADIVYFSMKPIEEKTFKDFFIEYRRKYKFSKEIKISWSTKLLPDGLYIEGDLFQGLDHNNQYHKRYEL